MAGLVDEEGTGKGVKHLIARKVLADYAVFGEPSGVDNITIAYKGSLHIKVACRTKTGHSSAPWLFKNAIEEAFEVWRLIKDVHFGEERSESRFYSLTSCMTGIRSGNDSSTVPSECEFHVDFRVPPQLTPQQVLRKVEDTVRRFRAENEDVDIGLEVEDVCAPFEADKDSPLTRAVSFAIRKVRNRPATLLRKTGTGDMNLLGSEMSIPMITYGPGDSSLDHTSDERINVTDYLDSISIICEGLKRLYYLDRHMMEK